MTVSSCPKKPELHLKNYHSSGTLAAIISCRINLPFVQSIYTPKVKAETRDTSALRHAPNAIVEASPRT